MRATWETVGRDEELALLVELVGCGRGAIVAGAAGIGKSRVARELNDRLTADGRTVRYLVATAAAGQVPLGALAPALPTLEVTGSGDRFALLRAVVADLTGPDPAGSATVVVIDDAHHLDDLSAAALHQVATTGVVTVVMTVRTGADAPDAIQSLWRDGSLTRLDLQALARREADQLVASLVGGTVAAPTLRLVWDLAAGNALFTRELVMSGLESGALGCTDGLWRWQGALTVTTRLADLIDQRVGRLDVEARHVLDLLAFGEPLDVELLAALGALDAAEALEAIGLVVLDEDGGRHDARLAHPLYGEVVRRRTPGLRARSIQRALADALEASGSRRRGDILTLARWRLAAGGRIDPEILVEAAELANAHFDHELAERLARAAATAGGSARAALALGPALIGQERFEDADDLLAAIDLASLDDDGVVRIAETRHVALSGLGDVEAADAMLAEADRFLTGDHWRGFLTAERAALLALAGQFADALALEPVLVDPALPEATRFRALSGLGVAWAMTGRSEHAVERASAVARAALDARARLPRAPGWVASAWLIGLLHGGRLDEADAIMDIAAAEVPSGFSDAWERLLTYRGASALLRGRPVTAAAWLRESTVLHGPNEPVRRASLSAALLAQSLALTGEVDEAASWIERARELRHGMQRWFDPAIEVADAWVHAAAQDSSAAAASLEAAIELSRATGATGYEALALHDLARLGDPRVAAPQLEAVAARAEGRLVAAYAAHAVGLAAGDGATLEAAADQFTAIGAGLYAAEALAAASHAHAQAGLRSRSAAAAARSAVLSSACEGARTPALASLTVPVTLSRRQHDIAQLAAEGMSNKEIAERLLVSVRTVEGHLYQAFAQLGVTRREDLPGVLGGSAPPRPLPRR